MKFLISIYILFYHSKKKDFFFVFKKFVLYFKDVTNPISLNIFRIYWFLKKDDFKESITCVWSKKREKIFQIKDDIYNYIFINIENIKIDIKYLYLERPLEIWSGDTIYIMDVGKFSCPKKIEKLLKSNFHI